MDPRARARRGGRSPWRLASFLVLISLLSAIGSLGGRELAPLLRGDRQVLARDAPAPEQSVQGVSIFAAGRSARPYEFVGARRATGPVAGFVDGPPNAVRGFSPVDVASALAAGPGEVSRVRRARARRKRDRRALARRGPAPGYRAQFDARGPATVAQAASAAVAAGRRLIVQVRRGHSVALHTRPGGPLAARALRRTEFGSPQALSVARRRGRWLGVTATGQPNGRLVWVDGASRSVRLAATRISVAVDLSSRTLVLRRGGRPIRRARVGIGSSATSTPVGRFTVTDKLAGGHFSTFYGCCILALSGVQPNLPHGWQGGNRLAIHGTNRPATVGQAITAGCLRVRDGALRALMAVVPLGAPVTIRR
jgi:lipoprotein-anchoring transpeptidase ErfK/SrfK